MVEHGHLPMQPGISVQVESHPPKIPAAGKAGSRCCCNGTLSPACLSRAVGRENESCFSTEPCCKVLKHCLEFGDNRAFHRAGGDTGPLMVRTMSSLYKLRRPGEAVS